MGATAKTVVSLPTSVSATGTQMRDVSDTLRHLWPSNTLMALVASGKVGDSGVKRKNLIGKAMVKQRLYECFKYIPIAISYAVTAYTSETSFSVSATDGLAIRLKQTLYNPTNGNVYRVSANSSGALTLVAVGTASAVATKVGDTLIGMAPAYGAGSSDPYIISRSEDQITNTTQISRFPVSIDNTTKGSPDYLGDYFKRLKSRNVVEGLRLMDVSAWFGRKAASTEVTADSTLADSFSSTDGIFTTAAYTHDCGGVFTHDFFVSDMIPFMSETMRDPNATLIMVTSQKVYGQMMKWANNNLRITEQGTLKAYGAVTTLFPTSGSKIEVMVADVFNRGDNYKKAIIINPEDYDYVHLRDRDLKPMNNIQSPSADLTTDDLLAEWGIRDNAGGYSAFTLTNVLP